MYMEKALLQSLRGGGRGEVENSAKMLALMGMRDEEIWDSEQKERVSGGPQQGR